MNIQQQTPFHDPNKKKEKRFGYDEGNRHLKHELICKYCNAVYTEKHWKPLKDLDPKYIDKLHKVVCPACHEQKNHVSDGILHLSGSTLSEHHEEIKNIIHNIEEKEKNRDILNRIERIEEKSTDAMIIYTSKNQLAVELGKKVSDAYKGGKLDIKWSKGDKPVEVYWHKDIL